ncbi:hypothetical protein D3C76_1768120 [compost metagenome]
MNIAQLNAELQETKLALRAARALLFAALEQLQQRGQFDPAAIALPDEALKSTKVKDWLNRVTEKPSA